MNANEILELVRAGYTRAEIEAMSSPAAAPAAESGAEDEEHTSESSASEVTDQSDTDNQAAPMDPAPDAKPAWATSLESTMAAMIKTMQATNRVLSGSGVVERVQTTDDILREMFTDPEHK